MHYSLYLGYCSNPSLSFLWAHEVRVHLSLPAGDIEMHYPPGDILLFGMHPGSCFRVMIWQKIIPPVRSFEKKQRMSLFHLRLMMSHTMVPFWPHHVPSHPSGLGASVWHGLFVLLKTHTGCSSCNLPLWFLWLIKLFRPQLLGYI